MVIVRTLFFLLTVVFHSSLRCEGYTLLQETFGDEDCLEDDWETHHPVGAKWFDNATCEQLQCIEANNMRYIQIYGCSILEPLKGCWLVPGSGNYPDCCPQEECIKRRGCTDDRNLTHSVGATWSRREPCQGFECKEDSGKFYIQTTNCSPPMDPPEGCWIGKGGLNSYPNCCPRVKCHKREQRGCKDGRTTYSVGSIWRGSSCDEFECKEDEHMYYIEHRNCSELHLVNTEDCWIQDPPGGKYPDCCPFIKCIKGRTNAI